LAIAAPSPVFHSALPPGGLRRRYWLRHFLALVQLGVEAVQLDIAELLHPQAGGDEERDDCLVTDAQIAVAESGVLVADSEHSKNLVVAVWLDLLVAGAAQPDPPRRVVVEVALLLGPVKHAFDDCAVVVDGGGRGRPERDAFRLGPAVGLGGHVVKKILEVGPGDAFWFRPLVRPWARVMPSGSGHWLDRAYHWKLLSMVA